MLWAGGSSDDGLPSLHQGPASPSSPGLLSPHFPCLLCPVTPHLPLRSQSLPLSLLILSLQFSSFLFPVAGACLPPAPRMIYLQLTADPGAPLRLPARCPHSSGGLRAPLICAAASPAASRPLALHPGEYQLLRIAHTRRCAPAGLRFCAH